MTAASALKEKLSHVRELMAQNDGGPWKKR
jgi:hypothetical protein